MRDAGSRIQDAIKNKKRKTKRQVGGEILKMVRYISYKTRFLIWDGYGSWVSGGEIKVRILELSAPSSQ